MDFIFCAYFLMNVHRGRHASKLTEEEEDEECLKEEEDEFAGGGGTRLLSQPSCRFPFCGFLDYSVLNYLDHVCNLLCNW